MSDKQLEMAIEQIDKHIKGIMYATGERIEAVDKSIRHTHRECAWLLGNTSTYHCCDSRGELFGKVLKEEDIDSECCEFFHSRDERRKESRYTSI